MRSAGLATALALLLLAGTALAATADARGPANQPGTDTSEPANPIQKENAQEGTGRWDLEPPSPPAIEGYASEASARPGQSFHLHVNAGRPGDRYRVYVYRLGWYRGSGGRLIECLPDCDDDAPYVPQPAAPRPDRGTGIVRAGWSVTDTVRVRSDWVSGYYVAVLRVTAGPDNGAVGRVPLIVRGPPGDRAAIVVQVPVNTWQAYNHWGGKSLYPDSSTGREGAVKVSFDRPYSEGVPVKPVFALELQAVRFLEREGYDVTYVTDADVDRSPGLLLNHRLALSIGHDEYWSGRMRDAWDIALDRSTNIAALGANTAYWQVRYEDARRTVVSYRTSAADPVKDTRARTTQFRSLLPGRPECRLFGVMYQYNAQRWAGFPPTKYIATAPRDPWMRGTGIERRDDIPAVVGYEWDTLVPGCFAGVIGRLFHADLLGSDGLPHPADAVRGRARSGARMFASGSIEFAWALDAYPNHLSSRRIQVFMENALGDLTRPAPPRPVTVNVGHAGVAVRAHPRGHDPRIRRVAIYRHAGAGRFRVGDPDVALVCRPRRGACRDALSGGTVRYAAVALDRWGTSAPWYSRAVKPPH
jgi:hypothetical protein